MTSPALVESPARHPNYPHLDPDTAAVMHLPERKRLDHASAYRYFDYPASDAVMDALEDLLHSPRSDRPECAFLTAHTNNGKTYLQKRFLMEHPHDPNRGGRAKKCAVVRALVPGRPRDTDFFQAILRGLGLPNNVMKSYPPTYASVLDLLQQVGAKVLLIDEAQHVGRAPSAKQRDGILDHAKNLSGEAQVNLVIAGIPDMLSTWIAEEQIANRASQHLVLPRFKMDETYLSMLKAFEESLPLKHPSGLATDEDTATLVLTFSEGLLGEVNNLLVLATKTAIRNGQERITAGLLRALQDGGAWILPKERRVVPHVP